MTLKFLDQIFPKKVLLGLNLRKQLSNSESAPLKTPMFRVSFEAKNFKVSVPNLPKKAALGMEFEKTITEFGISIFEYFYKPSFLKQSALKA